LLLIVIYIYQKKCSEACMANIESIISAIKTRYEAAVIQGDDAEATVIIQQGLHAGLPATRLYMDVLMTTQWRLGMLWHDGRINIAEEHLATQITRIQMMRLRQTFEPRTNLNRLAVITSVSEDMHDMGPMMVADFLYLDGWTVDFLGAGTPSDDLIAFVRKRQVDLLGLSATLAEHLNEVKCIVEAVRRLPNAPRILLGGRVLENAPEFVLETGVDGTASDVLEAMREARRLVGLQENEGRLEHYLQRLGKRIQTLRKARRLNQQMLAQAADLDRTYISAVEHGKQNLTLAAVMRLAEALDVPFEQLLVSEDGELLERS